MGDVEYLASVRGWLQETLGVEIGESEADVKAAWGKYTGLTADALDEGWEIQMARRAPGAVQDEPDPLEAFGNPL